MLNLDLIKSVTNGMFYNRKVSANPDSTMANEKILQTVFTGEVFQPVRLYYDVFDKHAVLKVFAKLRCMVFDQPRDRWVWLYQKEAKKLKFDIAYSAIPKKRHPIVLGSLFFRNPDKMVIDLRSFERATKAITFFDKQLSRSAAKVTDMAVVNKLFDLSAHYPALGVFFDNDNTVEKDPNAIFQDVESVKGGTSNRIANVLSLVGKKAKEPLPEIEKFPIYFYEDGISAVESILRMRKIIATEHWLGNENFSFFDLLKKIVPS